MKRTLALLAFASLIVSSVPTAAISVEQSPTLKEGDLISAIFSDDPDVYIVNEHGYKRLFLNPEIFKFYGHLGGFANVKLVTPEIRDSYKTSGYFRDCEKDDKRVFGVSVEQEDSGTLHWVDTPGEQAVRDDADFFKKVFCINNREFSWYPKGSAFKSVKEVPNYERKAYGLDRIAICHHETADASTWENINVASPSLEAHLKHGDTKGACPGTTPKPTPTPSNPPGGGGGSPTPTPTTVVCPAPVYEDGRITLWDDLEVTTADLAQPAADVGYRVTCPWVNVEGYTSATLHFNFTPANGAVTSGCQYALSESDNGTAATSYSTFLYFGGSSYCDNTAEIEFDSDYLRVDAWARKTENGNNGGTLNGWLELNAPTPTPTAEPKLHFIVQSCPNWSDISGNEHAEYADDSGGHYTEFANYSPTVPYFPDYNRPVLPREIPAACSGLQGWQFKLSTDNPQNQNVSYAGPTDLDGEVVVPFSSLTSGQRASLLGGYYLYATEVMQSGYQFAAIRCHRDVEYGDFKDIVHFNDVYGGAVDISDIPDDVYCIAYNVPN